MFHTYLSLPEGNHWASLGPHSSPWIPYDFPVLQWVNAQILAAGSHSVWKIWKLGLLVQDPCSIIAGNRDVTNQSVFYLFKWIDWYQLFKWIDINSFACGKLILVEQETNVLSLHWTQASAAWLKGSNKNYRGIVRNAVNGVEIRGIKWRSQNSTSMSVACPNHSFVVCNVGMSQCQS